MAKSALCTRNSLAMQQQHRSEHAADVVVGYIEAYKYSCLQIIGFVQILFLTCNEQMKKCKHHLLCFAAVPRQFELEAESLSAAAN